MTDFTLAACPSLTEQGHQPTRTISDILCELRERAVGSDYQRISAALLCRDIRQRIEKGELGKGVNWRVWMLENVRIVSSELFLLLAISEAADPRKELKRQRDLAAARQRKYAANAFLRTRERSPHRAEITRWLKDASAEDLTRVLRHIHAIDAAKATQPKQSRRTGEVRP